MFNIELSKDEIQNIANKIVDSIISDLTDRSGFDHIWYDIDEKIRNEIKSAWKEIAFTEIYKVVKYKDIVDG